MSVLDRSELEQSHLADLHAIAAELGINGYRRLGRDALIEAKEAELERIATRTHERVARVRLETEPTRVVAPTPAEPYPEPGEADPPEPARVPEPYPPPGEADPPEPPRIPEPYPDPGEADPPEPARIPEPGPGGRSD
jgi:hypothetical protein